jgi:hypothetical protein
MRKLVWLDDASDARVAGSFFVQARCEGCGLYLVQTWRPGVRERADAAADIATTPCGCDGGDAERARDSEDES